MIMEKELTPQQKMKKARTMLILNDPFYGALAMRMKMRPLNEKSPIECAMVNNSCIVDGKQIVYDPKWIETLDVFECKGLLAHEVSHVALKHIIRRGERDPYLWNAAGDFIIDPILKKAKFILPDIGNGQRGHIDPEITGKTTEEAYAILKKRQGEQQANASCPAGGDSPDDDPAPSDENANDTDAPGPLVPPQMLKPQLPPEPDDDDDDDQNDQNDQQQNQGGGLNVFNLPFQGAVLDAPVDMKNNTAVDEVDEELTIAIEQAYKAAKMCGNMPGDLERLIVTQKQHKIDWKEELRDFLEKSLNKNDYSWMRPSRRYMAHGMILPGMDDEEEIPQIVVVCDTSGSVSEDELEQYAAEISSVLEDFQCKFKVIYCDTKVRGEEEFEYEDLPIKLNAEGGGGTKFRPAFDYIKEQQIEHEAIVFFTDMDAFDWPAVARLEPAVPVLWLDSYGDIVERPGFKLPFGKHIPLEMED